MIRQVGTGLSVIKPRGLLVRLPRQPRASTSYSPPPSSLASRYSSLQISPSQAQNLRQDIDEFFAGYASESTTPLPAVPEPRRRTHAAVPLATDYHHWQRPIDTTADDLYDPSEPPPPREIPPFVSAIRMVQDFLTAHGFMTTRDIWQKGTEGERPRLSPAHMITEEGKIRMKHVSTVREQKRVWIPPPAAPMPDHPFQSVNYLKSTVLASLEAQGLIHKTETLRPFQTQEEQDEAIRIAMKLTRRAEKRAIKEQHPVPAPSEPATAMRVYGWRLGPHPEQVKLGNADSAWATDEGRWSRAVRMEEQFWSARTREARQTAARQLIRREAYKREREREKAQKAEDERLGRTDYVRKEKMRIAALEKIQQYARLTGEDVSGWYEELGQGEVGEVVRARPTTPTTQGGVRPRSKKFGLRA